MDELYKIENIVFFQKKLKKLKLILIFETIVFLSLVILLSFLMNYWVYRVYEIINIILTICYFFSVFVIFDLFIKPLRHQIEQYEKFFSSKPELIEGKIITVLEPITKNFVRYHILEIEVSLHETKRVYVQEDLDIFGQGKKYMFKIVDNIIVAYGESNDET